MGAITIGGRKTGDLDSWYATNFRGQPPAGKVGRPKRTVSTFETLTPMY